MSGGGSAGVPGEFCATTNVTTSVTTSNISIKESVLRAGVNYRFSGPVF